MTDKTGSTFRLPSVRFHVPGSKVGASLNPKSRTPLGPYRLNLDGPMTAHALVLRFKAWPTLCAVHLVFKIAPREAGS